MRSIAFGKPILGPEEKAAVARVLEGDILVHGPLAKEFEDKFARYTGSRFAISVSSCTAGLHLAYFYLGLGHGDEVIVPAQTHVATAHAVELTGAKPVFVDAEPTTGNIDIDQLERALTPRTRAISIVHYLGMPVNMDRILQLARQYDLFVVEDCALAIGTTFRGKHAGLHGNVGSFSFYPVKHMTTSEGGMLTTQSEEIWKKISRQKAFGVDRTVSERSVPGVYDVPLLGFNYRMSEIESAIGIHQLDKVDSFLERRKQNYETLSAGFKEISEISLFQSSHDEYQSSYYCHSILLNESLSSRRLEIVQYLREHGVGTSVYYPRAVPHFSFYKDKYGYSSRDFPIASWISGSSIALPVGPHLDTEDMHYIVDQLKNAIAKVK